MNTIYGFRPKILLYFQMYDTPRINYETTSQHAVLTFVSEYLRDEYLYKINKKQREILDNIWHQLLNLYIEFDMLSRNIN